MTPPESKRSLSPRILRASNWSSPERDPSKPVRLAVVMHLPDRNLAALDELVLAELSGLDKLELVERSEIEESSINSSRKALASPLSCVSLAR